MRATRWHRDSRLSQRRHERRRTRQRYDYVGGHCREPALFSMSGMSRAGERASRKSQKERTLRGAALWGCSFLRFRLHPSSPDCGPFFGSASLHPSCLFFNDPCVLRNHATHTNGVGVGDSNAGCPFWEVSLLDPILAFVFIPLAT